MLLGMTLLGNTSQSLVGQVLLLVAIVPRIDRTRVTGLVAENFGVEQFVQSGGRFQIVGEIGQRSGSVPVRGHIVGRVPQGQVGSR